MRGLLYLTAVREEQEPEERRLVFAQEAESAA